MFVPAVLLWSRPRPELQEEVHDATVGPHKYKKIFPQPHLHRNSFSKEFSNPRMCDNNDILLILILILIDFNIFRAAPPHVSTSLSISPSCGGAGVYRNPSGSQPGVRPYLSPAASSPGPPPAVWVEARLPPPHRGTVKRAAGRHWIPSQSSEPGGLRRVHLWHHQWGRSGTLHLPGHRWVGRLSFLWSWRWLWPRPETRLFRPCRFFSLLRRVLLTGLGSVGVLTDLEFFF